MKSVAKAQYCRMQHDGTFREAKGPLGIVNVAVMSYGAKPSELDGCQKTKFTACNLKNTF